ncbi:protein phosphatase regulator [Recurvomyces mirabilis]|uniref:Protein phosphatase regulator n=1 Tax=Recurvomyces mirabilis TaxID=574656 RepID=A0AAE0WY09_9PEZI|nr:protein phosphatase regulator [Recurvomyces mirabilis]KAK5161813.1 protein phosphatase regulator [Recurvomyces mirabilis]
MDSEQADKVAQFSAVTGANPSTAQTALGSANWNLEEAVALYYAASEDPQHDHDEDFNADNDEHLNEAMAQSAEPQSSSSAPAPSQPNAPRRITGQAPRAVTLRDLQRGEEDDDDHDDPDKKPDMFAGGEKSALAVQNPDRGGGPVDHFRNIMNQARQNRSRPGDGDDENAPAQPSHFGGRAQTLGGDDAPSQIINDPSSRSQQGGGGVGPAGRSSLPRVTRTLHLWSDGVSIDDGPLFRFDDPANQDMMAQIHQGRAPLSLLDVQPDQEVDLNLMPHKDEKYVKPKQKYKPFGGEGTRLGAPVPGPSGSETSQAAGVPAAAPTVAAPASSSSSDGNKTTEMAIDESTPTVQLQIRLGDGTQLRTRFNTTHTVGDVYEFVNRASSSSQGRSYALMTTFPSRELTDKGQVLGEMGEYKRGGVVVQKWT